MKKNQNLKFRTLLVFIGIFLFIQISYGQDCNKIPASFSSYEQASDLVKSSNFKIKESVNTSKSSWIRGATFYSCIMYPISRAGFNQS
jgi:hypothetical protein